MPPEIRFATRTDVGLRRERNEDALVVDESLGLFLVADGMGGHEHGEVASWLAADSVREAMYGGESLAEAIQRANRHILAEAGDTLFPMGTTVCAAHLRAERYQVAWVGDSRAYFYDGRLRLLTTDHTYVQDMVLRGELDKRHARRHPYRNMLLQALGVTDQGELQVDVVDGRLPAGSGLLLCTDGLNEGLDDDDIGAILAEAPSDVEVTADRLLKRALERGGSDNITLTWIWRET